jgi:hypothetical protein
MKDVMRESDREVWQYAAPHTTREHGVFVRQDSLYRDLKDLNGRDIVVLNGSHAREWLGRHGFRNHLVGVDSLSSGLSLLSTGNYEALVCDHYEGLHEMSAQDTENVRLLSDSVIPVETGFAILRQDESLAEALESGMTTVKKTGEFDKIRKEWLSGLEPHDTGLKLGAVYSYALWVLIPALIFLGSACVSFFAVRKKSMERIRELEIALAREQEKNADLLAVHAKQTYVINQMSAVSLVDQLAGVSGGPRN